MIKKKLLLAEDDEDDTMLFLDFLKDREDLVLVYSCENGIEVIEYLDTIEDEREFPHLVLLDQNMPKMNGSQTLKVLKDNPRYASIPVAVYTTHSDKRLLADCYQSGAAAVLSKPISPTGYYEMMDELNRLIQ